MISNMNGYSVIVLRNAISILEAAGFESSRDTNSDFISLARYDSVILYIAADILQSISGIIHRYFCGNDLNEFLKESS